MRRKVQEMTWKEGSGSGEGGESGEKGQEWEELKQEEVEEAKKNAVEDTQAKDTGSEGGVKRKPLDRNDSSFLEKAEPVKKVRDTPSVRSFFFPGFHSLVP